MSLCQWFWLRTFIWQRFAATDSSCYLIVIWMKAQFLQKNWTLTWLLSDLVTPGGNPAGCRLRNWSRKGRNISPCGGTPVAAYCAVICPCNSCSFCCCCSICSCCLLCSSSCFCVSLTSWLALGGWNKKFESWQWLPRLCWCSVYAWTSCTASEN